MKIQSIKDLIPGVNWPHTGTFGATRSGKSYESTEEIKIITNHMDSACIYFNYPDKKNDKYSIPGRRFSSATPPKKVAKALMNGETVKYDRHSDVKVASKELNALYYKIASQIPVDVRIYIDEAHIFDEKIMSEIIDDGAGNGVYFNIITQYPSRLKNSDYGKYLLSTIESVGIWKFFQLSDQQKGFLNHYGYDYEKLKALTSDDYAFAVTEGNKIIAGPLKA